VVGRQNADIADALHLRYEAMVMPCQPFLAFYIRGAHWRHLANTTEPSMCGGDAALCQITLTTCYHSDTFLTYTVHIPAQRKSGLVDTPKIHRQFLSNRPDPISARIMVSSP